MKNKTPLKIMQSLKVESKSLSQMGYCISEVQLRRQMKESGNLTLLKRLWYLINPKSKKLAAARNILKWQKAQKISDGVIKRWGWVNE